MSGCPTQEDLERYLAESQSAGPSKLRDHVETCPQCQQRLAEAHEDEALIPDVRRLLETTDSVPLEPTRSTTPHPRVPSAIIGYELVRELHRGGQGVVYQAVQQATKRKVAIKVLLEGPYASRAARRRFEREIELVAQLKHPNIISVFHSGTTTDGRQFCVMDYVRGTSLTRYVHEQQPPLEAMLELFATICDAVNYAHQKGVIHRDLKPSNILVDVEGHAQVLDFGLAKQLADPVETLVSATGQVVGTLPYASPEQTRGNPDEIDVRTDVYSLGVILYELLTGGYPYPVTGELSAVLQHITHTPPAPPASKWTADSGVTRRAAASRAGQCPIDGELETIVLKALSKERERRYQSAGELARDIRHYLADEPIEARRDSGWYVLRKSLHRYRVPVSLIGGLVLLAAVSAVGFAVLYGRAETARRAAVDQRAVAQAVIEFLTEDLIEAAQPEELGKDVRVREVLDLASAQISRNFAQRPLVEAAIRRSVGRTYRSLGEYGQAQPHLEQALHLLRNELGMQDPLTLDCAVNLGYLYREQELYDKAESVYAEAVETARRLYGPEETVTLQYMNHLAAVYDEQGRYDQAEPMYRKIYETQKRRLGDGNIHTVVSLHNLGDVCAGRGHYQDAEQHFQRAWEGLRALIGPEHDHSLRARGNLAWVRHKLGRHDEAERMYTEIVQIRRRDYGDAHKKTLRCLANLGEVQYRAGRHAAALATLEECDRLYGPGSESPPPQVLALLALSHHELHDPGAARRALDRLQEIMKLPRWKENADAQQYDSEARNLVVGPH